MTNLQQARALQREGRALRKRYLRPGDERSRVRDAIQWANDTTFANPPPDADDEARGRWAGRWLKKYEDWMAGASTG